jgi:choline-glycine betaine transporter
MPREIKFNLISKFLMILSLILILIAIILSITSFYNLHIILQPASESGLSDFYRILLSFDVIHTCLWGISCMISGSILLTGSLKLMIKSKNNR